jgi:guanylate kinase|nr:MAG TPA: Guanylate kinase [Caudoviricetes sp.]
MLVLIGKSASGKTTIAQELVKKHGFHSIVRYTTRPIRDDETQDVAYHFIATDEFIEKVNNGFFIEWKDYVTNEGLWYYGTAIEDIKNADEDSVIILTPQGIRDLKNLSVKNMTVLYIYSNNFTIEHRLEKRGDKGEEICRRMSTDALDFKNAELLADKIVYNNYSDKFENVIHNVLWRYGR